MRLSLNDARSIVASGGIVVYPTETLWGLGGNALLSSVSDRVKEVKQVVGNRPFPVLADSVARVLAVVAQDISGLDELIERFWPGGLTLVLPLSQDCNQAVGSLPLSALPSGPQGGVALRVSAHPAAVALATAAGGFLVSTSANLTGVEPPRRAGEVSNAVIHATDGIVDDKSIGDGRASTLLEYNNGCWHLLRKGVVSSRELGQILGVSFVTAEEP
jgi:L-threonylcarbamoyladenylate synthase